jgi:hypothetical protein
MSFMTGMPDGWTEGRLRALVRVTSVDSRAWPVYTGCVLRSGCCDCNGSGMVHACSRSRGCPFVSSADGSRFVVLPLAAPENDAPGTDGERTACLPSAGRDRHGGVLAATAVNPCLSRGAPATASARPHAAIAGTGRTACVPCHQVILIDASLPAFSLHALQGILTRHNKRAPSGRACLGWPRARMRCL